MKRRAKMTAAQAKEKQQRIDAGLISELFQKVTQIAISMLYSQAGESKPLSRTVNFFPDSSAFFKVDCVNRECVNGGFDLTQVITGMVNKHKETAKGKLSCEGNGPIVGHSSIAYNIQIIYV